MKTLLHANKKYQTLFINSQKIYLLYPMYLKYFARDSIYLNLWNKNKSIFVVSILQNIFIIMIFFITIIYLFRYFVTHPQTV